jgi:drug/metabolite transporter (DMT)-like permease
MLDLGEIPGPLQWSGIALIVGGLFIAAWKKPVAA